MELPVVDKECNNDLSSYEKYARELKTFLPDLPKVDVIMKNYSMKIKKPSKSLNIIPNVITGSYYELIDSLRLGKTKEQTVLKDISYHFKAGSSTLVFGSPSSGTTSFLKAIAGYIPKNYSSGSITCNGKSFDSYNWKKMCGYCGQVDIQLPSLTVEDTFEFAVHCLNGKGAMEKLGHPRIELDISNKSNMLMERLGLTICKDTIVGDDTSRGISGGEMKRVSLGEVLASPARVLLLDKISTGLDSAVTFDICKFLNQWVKIFEGILVCHLLQPDPEVIALFDNVIVLSEGEIIYSGSSNYKVIHCFFENCGYSIPINKDLGSFLSDVGQEQLRDIFSNDKTMDTSKTKLVGKYHETEEYKNMIKEIEVQQTSSSSKEIKNNYNNVMFNNKYSMSFFQQFCFLLRHHCQLTYKNTGFIIGRMVQHIICGLLVGWIFFDIKKDDYISKIGGLFMVLSTLLNGSMAIIFPTFFQKPTMYKQLQQGYYSSTAYVTSSIISKYPLQLIESILFGTIIYAMMNYTWSDNAEHYFIYILSLFVGYMDFMSCYGVLMYLTEKIGSFQAILPVINFIMNTFNGFSITKNSIPKWLIEFYYISPLAYMTKAQVVNEFMSSRYTKEEAELYLGAFDFVAKKSEIWYSILILFCQHLFFVLLQIIVLSFRQFDPYMPSITIDNAQLKEASDKLKKQISEKRSTESEIPIHPVDFSFEHVKYTVTVKDPTTKKKIDKVLLNDISGFVRAHSMTALMGASGAGKTTLLDVLADRKTVGKIEGEFLLNGHKYNHNDLCMLSGYVEQQDTLIETETVEEALLFSARLRYPGNPTDKKIKIHVKETLELLGLKEYRDMLIGTVEHGLQMGIRKLVMVGIELAANPSILFLDEPTTGLDSSSALLVCQILQRICSTGRSIICTIHQPSFEMFKLFTDVLLLERGGKVVYCGALGENGSKVVEYISGIENVPKKKEEENPACWMLEVTGAGVDNKNTIEFGEHYFKTDLYQNNLNIIDEIKHSNQPEIKSKSKYSVSLIKQINEVTKRNFRIHWRRLDFNLSRLRQVLISAIATGVVYFKIDDSTQGGLQSKFMALSLNMMWAGMNHGIPISSFIFYTRLTYYRENAMRTYRPIAHLISLLLVEAIVSFFFLIIFNLIFYPMVGFSGDSKIVLTHFVIMYAWYLFCSTSCSVLSYILPEIGTITTVFSLTLATICTIAGFLIPYESLKYPWKALYWINPETFIVSAVTANQFKCGSYKKGDFINNLKNCPTVLVGENKITIQDYFEMLYGTRFDLMWNFVGYQFIAYALMIILLFIAITKVRLLSR